MKTHHAMKKTFIIIAIFIIVGGAAYAAWQLFGRKAILGTNHVAPPPASTEGEAGHILQPLVETPVFSYWAQKATDDVYIVGVSGQISVVQRGGPATVVSPQNILDLRWVTHNSSGDLAAVLWDSGGLASASIFHTKDNSWQPLPTGIVSAAWNPEGTRLAYAQSSETGTTI